MIKAFVTSLQMMLMVKMAEERNKYIVNMTTDFMDETSFPLYDLLLKKYKKLVEEDRSNSDITIEEVREMIDGIRSFDREKMEHVFVIIRIHSLRNEKSKVFDIPFNGERINMSQTGEGDIKFDIRNMPGDLRRMLLEFVRINKQID